MGNTVKYVTAALAANSKTLATADLGDNTYSKVFVAVPTFSTAAEVEIWCSNDGSSFFKALTSVGSAANGTYQALNYVAPYVKLICTGTVCVAATAHFICYQ